MAIACPHCRAPYFSMGQVFANAVRVYSASSPLRCVLCDGLSIVALRGPNAWWALVVLALGVAASYPSALSYGYLANVPELEARIIRANIWMAAVTVAYLTFAFSGRLQKLEGTAVGPTNRWASLVTILFLGVIVLYGFWLLRG